MEIKNLIFDVDGTLWDTTPLAAKAWNAMMSKFSLKRAAITEDDLKSLFGKPMDYIIDRLFPDICTDSKLKYLASVCEIEDFMLNQAKEDMMYPGVCNTIKQLHGKVGLYIVSNCQKGYIETLLSKANLWDYIADFECFGNNGLQKGANIRLVVQRGHLENAFYVGDIQSDCDSSKEAGIPFIHAAYGFGKVLNPDIVIHDFKELLTLI